MMWDVQVVLLKKLYLINIDNMPWHNLRHAVDIYYIFSLFISEFNKFLVHFV